MYIRILFVIQYIIKKSKRMNKILSIEALLSSKSNLKNFQVKLNYFENESNISHFTCENKQKYTKYIKFYRLSFFVEKL